MGVPLSMFIDENNVTSNYVNWALKIFIFPHMSCKEVVLNSHLKKKTFTYFWDVNKSEQEVRQG